MYNPYAPPGPVYDPYRAAQPPYPPQRPQVWIWYIVYCVFMTLSYLSVAGAGVVTLVTATRDPEMIQGVLYVVLGLPFAMLYGVAPFLPKRPWVWIFHLVLICLAMTSMCCIPICVPLLIFWIRADNKAYFGRY